LLAELDERLVDKYFVNFSIFESMPDAWAIDQAFPIVPIERLDEAADRRGTIADLTCDSDGAILTYVHDGKLDSAMSLHAVRAAERYRLGFFLVGAYQEILGDIHNLFGDTDAIEVEIDECGYKITTQRRGDSTDAILDYVGYKLPDLRVAYAEKVEAARLPAAEARLLAATLESGLTGYTYLADACGSTVPSAMECRA
jgi:arginine decarboxylase